MHESPLSFQKGWQLCHGPASVYADSKHLGVLCSFQAQFPVQCRTRVCLRHYVLRNIAADFRVPH